GLPALQRPAARSDPRRGGGRDRRRGGEPRPAGDRAAERNARADERGGVARRPRHRRGRREGDVNRVTLNLATRPFRNTRVVGPALPAVAAATAGATAYNAYAYLNYSGHYRELQEDAGQHKGRLESLDAEERRLSKEIATRDYRRLFNRGQFASGLITR